MELTTNFYLTRTIETYGISAFIQDSKFDCTIWLVFFEYSSKPQRGLLSVGASVI